MTHELVQWRGSQKRCPFPTHSQCWLARSTRKWGRTFCYAGVEDRSNGGEVDYRKILSLSYFYDLRFATNKFGYFLILISCKAKFLLFCGFMTFSGVFRIHRWLMAHPDKWNLSTMNEQADYDNLFIMIIFFRPIRLFRYRQAWLYSRPTCAYCAHYIFQYK